jgi:Flp pilus assembly protein TadD/tRNA A-37 threonylcarbamoyl transferase component Bud32
VSRARTSTIGPYRLEERLGTGGMGEVWRAWDGRLDRSVAVKLIRPESAEDHTARERFRREARAAAALTHPSVVRIYDIIDSGEGDAIVMELVEGELLAKRIARDRLPLEEALRLGQQIAEGLAAAHRRGILHRDLKAENVIVTPEGEAKVLDFGLAKRLDGETEESLTRATNVVGTFRTMSPEQARGLPLDPRSDLFSFGVLLYEMLTCQSPFKAETALGTLQRICGGRQVPIQELRPEIPAALAVLVNDLLEKDASFRPPSAQDVAARLEAIRDELRGTLERQETWVPLGAPTKACPAGPGLPDQKAASRLAGWKPRTAAVLCGALLLLVVLGLAVPRFRRPPLVHVAMLRPEVTQGGGMAGVDAMTASLLTSLQSGLLSLEGVSLLPPEQVDPISGSPGEVGRATAASEVFASQLSCRTDVCQVSVNRLRSGDGVLLWAETFSVPLDRPYLMVDTLQGALAEAYPDRRPSDSEVWLQVAEADYVEYLRLYQSYDTRREEDLSADELLEHLAQIRQTSPRFLEVWMFESYILQQKFRTGRDRRDLERAYEALEQARKLAPDDPRPLVSLFDVAFLGEDLDRAEAALADLELMQPGDARLLANRARLLDRKGDSEQALLLMRKATERLPSWRHLFWMAEMGYRQGKVAAAREDLQELLKRSPGNMTGESLLAQLELYDGDPREAAKIYERLAQRSPQFSYLSNLGTAQFLLGHLEQAEQSFRRAAELAPGNPFVVLNLADTRLLLGDRRGADDLYRKTLRLADADPTAGSNWQISSVRAQALAHLGRSGEAVAQIQEALHLAPNNPMVAYEVSLVSALLGDEAAALFNAERALAQGYQRRWFNLPWFDPIRSELELEGPSSELQNGAS